MKQIASYFASLRNNYKLLLWACLPALALTAFGLYQVQVQGVTAWSFTLMARFIVEFAFLSFVLALLNLLGLKNKWLLALLLYFYYISMTADFVLLWYFKERFGAKYLSTLQGGDYDFLTDWRILSYLILLGVFCGTLLKKCFAIGTRKVLLKQAVMCAVILTVFSLGNPFFMLGESDGFFARYFLPPSPVYTTKQVLTKPLQAHITPILPKPVAETAQQYHVFNAAGTGIGKNYTRVILIATESLSAKYLHRFNPLIPPAASRGYDQLFEHYPATTLQTVTLSTLYGLSVIFSSHPYAELSFQNGYPISFVKTLKEHGFHTAFFRGAHEDYMHENELFEQAGFETVQGWNFFETQPQYAQYLDWWGLLDRKLFEYAADYLQAHPHEKTFLTLLTVDTHVPLGRTDYLDQSYEEIDTPFYEVPTMPRAYARAGQDLSYFLQLLKEKKLLDEHTLILVTGDHPSYSNTPTNALFKPYQEVFDRIPLAIITAPALQKPLTTEKLASQLDIAPTVLDLLNLPQPKGFFGHSLFDTTTARSVFDIKEDYVVVTTQQGRQVIPLNSTQPTHQPLINLIRTFWVD